MQRTSTIADVTVKDGRTGRLVFVKVQHDLRVAGAADPSITEWHDIVYREAKRADDVDPAPTAVPTDAAWQRTWTPDDVMLFRYSALTFNGHRIHYDRRYVTQVEGYPGLIVHGPLIATLLMDLLRREMPDADVAEFRFRAVRPTFDGATMQVNGQLQANAEGQGKTVKLWAQDHAGWLTMDAVATLR
jgi:3-methylfumaryl-CoA hydratase